MFGAADQPKGLLASAQLQPQNEMGGIPFDRLLEQFKGTGELLINAANSRGQPGHEPIVRREQQRLFKTIIGARFLPCQEHIGARQPEVRRVPPFFDGSIGKNERALKVAGAGQGDGFGRQQLGFLWKALEGFVGPEFGFAELAEFNQHTHLAGPGGGSPEKPVGLVHVALAWDGGVSSTNFNWSGTRLEIQSRTAKLALNMVRLHLLK